MSVYPPGHRTNSTGAPPSVTIDDNKTEEVLLLALGFASVAIRLSPVKTAPGDANVVTGGHGQGVPQMHGFLVGALMARSKHGQDALPETLGDGITRGYVVERVDGGRTV